MSADKYGPLVTVQIEGSGVRGIFESQSKVDTGSFRVVVVPRPFTPDEVHEVAQGAQAAIDMIVGRISAESESADRTPE